MSILSFQTRLNHRELLFMNGDVKITRKDLLCLCPGKEVEGKVGFPYNLHICYVDIMNILGNMAY